MDKVIVEPDGGLRVLTLNHPDKRNIIDDTMRAELVRAVTAIRSDPDATALVVTGAGSAFCGGADLPALFGDTTRDLGTLREDLQKVYESFLVLRSLSIPTIAAVQGPAIGAGLNLAMVCDLRIAGPGAKFGATFSQIGLHPGGGCTWFLVQALGSQRALKLLLDGGTLTGAEAVEAGLALSLEDDPVAAATALGRTYARMDPRLARHIKSAVRIAATEGFEATLEFESWAQAYSATQPGIQEFLARFRK
ncbi:enoyl-CoA hydratase [Nonomuraea sp. C10]|uniref:enoyl-CoA hydratase n=1 Tax=Nonomuraea sp. C10 TaxID=2600577 RepID=UPI0011CDE707|nr:enoyl-CoA hydratase [Nonomuraea sp. C10]TXK38958.1 enoyl-CoA hydratase [Nonomuraea sp. C10]